MACPRCGSPDYRSVAPGVAECAVQILALSAAGRIEHATTYRLPVDAAPLKARGDGLDAATVASGEVFLGESRLAGVSLPTFLNGLVTAVESVLAGSGRRGALACRP